MMISSRAQKAINVPAARREIDMGAEGSRPDAITQSNEEPEGGEDDKLLLTRQK